MDAFKWCLVLWQANHLADAKYECPLCGFSSEDATSIKPLCLESWAANDICKAVCYSSIEGKSIGDWMVNKWMNGVRAVYILTAWLILYVCLCVCACAYAVYDRSPPHSMFTRLWCWTNKMWKRGENCSARICLNTSELDTSYDDAAANIFCT